MSKRIILMAAISYLLGQIFLPQSSHAQSREKNFKRAKGFYFSLLSSSIDQPIFRRPSGSEEVPVLQKKGTWGAKAGIEFIENNFGGGIGLVYWKADFDEFQINDAPPFSPSPTLVSYKDPSYSLFFVDLMLYLLPAKKVPFGFYGFLGLGADTEKYTIEGPQSDFGFFSEWNGKKSLTEFQYSYGLGVRWFPVRHISLVAEYRWVPGDLTQELDEIGRDPNYVHYRVTDSRTENFANILSFGLAIDFSF